MDGINNNTPVNRTTKIMGYDTSKAVNITHMLQMGNTPKMSTDSYVKVSSGSNQIKHLVHHEYLRMNAGNPAVSGMTQASEAVLSEVDATIGKFFDGSLSAEELQAEYEKLAKQYVNAFEENNYPLSLPTTEARQAITENFYDNFRQRILHTAVQRNFAEGQTHLTGEMNAQRSWKYYNADYYYESEAAISAVTDGAEAVAQEYGLKFEVPDYKAQGLNMYYNFNSAWSNNFEVSQQYMIDADMVPPENFEWFFEHGGDSSSRGGTMTLYSIGDKIVYEEPEAKFDPKDPMTARTWASYTDSDGKKHSISTDFRFNYTPDDLKNVADLLKFIDGNSDEDKAVNKFLANLQAYDGGYFYRNGATRSGINIQA